MPPAATAIRSCARRTWTRLAARGTRFASAYCNSPICVPSRASMATGRYVHETGHWDNAMPYDGTPRAWHHAVRDAGMDCVSIGKLHFRGAGDHGFSHEILPLHVKDGIGDLKGSLRAPLPEKKGVERMARDARRGGGDYAAFDARVRDEAVAWLRAKGEARRGVEGAEPFVLFVSLTMPHFPLQAPEAFYDLYADLPLDVLMHGLDGPQVDHPALVAMRRNKDYDAHFDDARRAVALRAYYGMVSAVDAMLGDIVGAIGEAGLGDDTRILYTSDHGESLGHRRMWGKSVMYEDGVAVPMILAGPDVPSDRVCRTPVSLVDVHPTVLRAVGLEPVSDLPGRALDAVAIAPDEPERPVFAEYHASGSITGFFMLRRGDHKLVAYPGYPPQLFDLAADPCEHSDLASDPAHADLLARMTAELAQVCDIDAVNARAMADQERLVAKHGGREAVLQGTDIPFTPVPT